MLKAYKSGSLDDIRPIEEISDITEEFLASCSATIVDFLDGIGSAKSQGQHGRSLSRRYSCICTYIDGYSIITNVIIAQPEILRSILRVVSRGPQCDQSSRRVSCCSSPLELFRAMSLLQPLIVADKVDLVRCQRPVQPIALCLGSPCNFQAFDSDCKRPHNGHL